MYVLAGNYEGVSLPAHPYQWEISSPRNTIARPVRYGWLPRSATQDQPTSSRPPYLDTGADYTVVVDGVGAKAFKGGDTRVETGFVGGDCDPVITTVEVTPGATTIEAGETLQLGAVARDSGGNVIGSIPFKWSKYSSILSVKSSGLVTAISEGQAWVYAQAEGVTGGALVTVIPGSTPGGGGDGTPFVLSDATGNLSLTRGSLKISGGKAAVAWAAYHGGYQDVWFDYSDDLLTQNTDRKLNTWTGTSATSRAYSPWVGYGAGGRVWVAWNDMRNTPASTIYLAYADTPGGSFTELSAGAGGLKAMLVDPAGTYGTIYIVYWDNGAGKMYLIKSTNAGSSFSSPLEIAGVPANVDDAELVSGNIHVVSASSGIVYYRVIDTGVSAYQLLANNTYYPYSPTLAVNGSNIYVAWSNESNSDLPYRWSSNNGGAWSSPVAANVSAGTYPSLAADGSGKVHLFYRTNTQLFHRTTTDGNTWSSEAVLATETHIAAPLAADASGQDVGVIYNLNDTAKAIFLPR
jgi:hypothetical protein